MTDHIGVGRSRLSWAVLVLVLLALACTAAVAVAAGGKGDKGEWTNIHLIYTTDIKGKIEPCG